jgi:quercetin dioxygenase-like cupin family protein
MKNSRRVGMVVLFAAPVLVFAAATALAQDPVKVSPGTHKVLLENDKVRVLDVRVKPGQKVPMHSHPDFIVYALNDFKVKFTYPDGKTAEAEGKAGTATWKDAESHAGENLGTTELHVLNIELKGAAKKPAPAKGTAPTKKAM